MNQKLMAVELLKLHIEQFGGITPAPPMKVLVEVEQRLRVDFPEDYRQFLLMWDGGEFENIRLYLFGIDNVDDFNPHSVWSLGLPGMVFLGNDGGDEVFYFDPANYLGKGSWAIYGVDMGCSNFDSSRYVAKSFTHLIQRALNQENLMTGSYLGDERNLPKSD